MKYKSQGKHRQGNQDGRDAIGMTGAVHRMLVAAFVFRNPLFAGLPAEHAAHDNTRSGNRFRWYVRVRKQLVRHKSWAPSSSSTELGTPILSVLIAVIVSCFFRRWVRKKTTKICCCHRAGGCAGPEGG